MKKFVALAGALNNFGKAIKMLFAKPEAEKAPVIAPIAPEKVVIKIGDSAHISGITEVEIKDTGVFDHASWDFEIEANLIHQENWERLIRKPNRINKKLNYKKKKSQAKNWDKWKRKGVN